MAPATFPRNIGAGEWSEAPDVWEGICSALAQYRRLYVFADFDGTLSQLVEVPSKAVLDPHAERALRRLSAEARVSLAVISGRSVDDVASRIGLPIAYAGDYGLEIHTPDIDFTVPDAHSARRKLPELCNRIREATQHISGTLVEAKHFTASVHFRQVASHLVPGLLDIVRNCVLGSEFEIRPGTYALEVKPRVDWSKGDAVSWLLSRYSAVPEQAVCIGDDETDEDMFRKLTGAVRIRVTNGTETVSTVAPYCVRRDDLGQVLNGIADVAEAICCR
jgi:trehalose-phosphatase